MTCRYMQRDDVKATDTQLDRGNCIVMQVLQLKNRSVALRRDAMYYYS